MSCVNSTSFAVLVNGSASSLFKGSHGIRQGCPLSPYLFLLVIKGLGLLLSQALKDKQIFGVKVFGNIHISHTLFPLYQLNTLLILCGDLGYYIFLEIS